MHYLMSALLSLLFLTGACQSGQQQRDNTGQEAPLSSTADTVPSVDQQLTAPDTLFEDGSEPASWSDAGFDDPVDFKRFIIKFKEWVKTDEVDSIVAHIDFPLEPYKTPADFRQKYPEIFDEKLKAIVEQQRLDRIFRNADGAMLGDGEIWFNSTDKGYRIIAINK